MSAKAEACSERGIAHDDALGSRLGLGRRPSRGASWLRRSRDGLCALPRASVCLGGSEVLDGSGAVTGATMTDGDALAAASAGRESGVAEAAAAVASGAAGARSGSGGRSGLLRVRNRRLGFCGGASHQQHADAHRGQQRQRAERKPEPRSPSRSGIRIAVQSRRVGAFMRTIVGARRERCAASSSACACASAACTSSLSTTGGAFWSFGMYV